jgi:hypothetical protein
MPSNIRLYRLTVANYVADYTVVLIKVEIFGSTGTVFTTLNFLGDL